VLLQTEHGKAIMTAIIDDAPVEILGTEVYKIWKTISVAFQYLDAREDLSIQVHPNDELAKKDIILLVKPKCGISCKLMMMPE
jgi:mannose-6-phosphate isomerase class I